MEIKTNFDLSKYNAYNIKSKCAKVFFPDSENEILEIFNNNNKDSVIILGNGNNVILSKEMYDESFMVFNGNFNSIIIKDSEIIAEAGATLEQLSEKALEFSLSGLEIFYDIPSSVGGAVVMNAGTKEGEIKDVLIKVRYLDLEDLKIKEINRDNIEFEYRNSFFQKHANKIVLRAWFNLVPGNAPEIRQKMENVRKIRWSKQPREFSNCGSVFKRPPGKFVGPMIDELGMKGFKIGDAMISPKHSGFIVNIGNAKGSDILKLIEIVRNKVKEKFDIELEVEQRIL